VAGTNELVVMALEKDKKFKIAARIDLATDSKLALISALGFNSEGTGLWAVLGSSTATAGADQRPTSLVTLQFQKGKPAKLSVASRAVVEQALAPLVVAPLEVDGNASTSIGSAGGGFAAVLSTVDPRVLSFGWTATSAIPEDALAGLARPGLVLLAHATGESKPVLELDGVISGLAVSPRRKYALAVGRRFIPVARGGKLLEFGLYVVPLGGASSFYLRLADAPPSSKLLAPSPIRVTP
jgi:hypothetical protein